MPNLFEVWVCSTLLILNTRRQRRASLVYIYNHVHIKVIMKGAQWPECQIANQAARVRILANTNGFILSVLLTPGCLVPT